MEKLLEPLELSAPLARELAPTLCRGDATTGVSCAWNHGFWQDLRLLGLVGTPAHDAEFFREAFAPVAARASAPRVLITGTADYGMLSRVHEVFGTHATVTVIDVCETPLALNRWYAERTGIAVATRRVDVLGYEEPQGYDVVCAHEFLGRFPRSRRPALVERWCELLNPRGIVVTVNRVRPSADPEHELHFTVDQRRAFCDRVRVAAGMSRNRLGIGLEEILSRAEDYASHYSVYPVASIEDCRTLFENAGFRVDHVSLALPSIVGGQASVPSVRGSGDYVRIIASRP